jgi:gluconate kinase
VIALRMAGRKGHFMPPALLESQLATLERPGADEDAVILDITEPVDQLIDEAYAAARARPGGSKEG